MSLVQFLLGTFLLFVISDAQSCDSGWKQVKRVKGDRCLKIFSASTAVTYEQAQALCKKSNGVVGGLENKEELDWFKATITKDFKQDNIFIGAHKKIECVNPPLPQSCYPLVRNQWYWEDRSVNGTPAILRVTNAQNNYDYAANVPVPLGLQFNFGQFIEASFLEPLTGYFCSKELN